jgi:hypothetical protein
MPVTIKAYHELRKPEVIPAYLGASPAARNYTNSRLHSRGFGSIPKGGLYGFRPTDGLRAVAAAMRLAACRLDFAEKPLGVARSHSGLIARCHTARLR